MNVKHLAVAGVLSTGLVAGSAFALPHDAIDPLAPGANDIVIHYAGSTAQKETVSTLTSDYCDLATRTVYNNNAADPSAQVITCTLLSGAAATTAGVPASIQGKNLYFSYYLNGGSIYGVTPVADHLNLDYMAVHSNEGGNCDASNVCSNSAGHQYSTAPIGGGSDVEPALFKGSNIVGLTFGAPSAAGSAQLKTAQAFNVIFGIAVNCSLLDHSVYTTCTSGPSGPLTSLSYTSLVSILTQGGKVKWEQIPEFGQVADRNSNGVNDMDDFLFGSIPGTTINICRRKPGSGTQASAQTYFGNQECGGVQRLFVSNATDGVRVQEISSSSQILTNCVDVTPDSIAISGTEKEAARADDKYGHNWAYIKIDGIAPTKENAAMGRYTYMFENSMQYNTVYASTGAKTFLDAMFALASKASALSGVPGSLGIPDGTINIPADVFDLDGDSIYGEYTELNPVSWTTRGGLACRVPSNIFP